jgi:putrescine aminotransferase
VDPSDPAAVATVVEEQSVAALLIEPVQGENGVITLDPAIVRRWCEDARAAGAFVISDEIQAGLRRCGPRSVAVTDGLAVDAVLIGKPLGGGVLPVSAMLAREVMYEPLIADPFRHSATFSGYPLAAAAVPAALDAIERHAANGVLVAASMERILHELHSRRPDVIRAVRGRGLLWGVDFHDPATAGEVQFELAARGVVVSPCLGRPETLRLLPPLVCTQEDVNFAGQVLSDVVDYASKIRDSEKVSS